MQFGIAAGQIQAVDRRQVPVVQGREEHELRALIAQQVEVGAIEEGERLVAGYTDAHTGKACGRGVGVWFDKGHRRRQGSIAAGAQGLGGSVQTCIQIVQLTGLDQAEVTAGQLDAALARQPAIPAQTFGQATFEQLRMAQAADPVGQHASEWQVRLVARQAQGQGPEGLGHGRAIDHRQHRHAEMPRQVSARRRTVEQPHDTFDEDQVGVGGSVPQQTAALLFANHPHVQLVHRRAAGALQDHRVEKIRPALEHPHLAPEVAVQARQGGGDGGLALAGGWCGNQHRRAMTGGSTHSSTPFCARIPAWKACLSMPISVTVSASSIISGLAPRPVTITCCIGGRAWMSESTWSRSR
ncbi:MAG: hypothetical protein GAK45_02392 [Pseudomonas citronellolis]|nr:MAG: hypothetical protein GAK45_02392 [Pseudomonas citronellolis]